MISFKVSFLVLSKFRHTNISIPLLPKAKQHHDVSLTYFVSVRVAVRVYVCVCLFKFRGP